MCTEQNPDPGVIQSPAEGQTEPTVATPAPPTEPVSSLKELDWTPTKLPNFWGRLLGFTSWSVISGFMTAVCLNGMIITEKAEQAGNYSHGLLGLYSFFGLLFFALVTMAGFAFLFPHLYDYYKVRVLGHNLVCVYNENKTMSYYIRHRGEKTLPQHDLALVLPISGLFTKPRIISKNDARGWGYPGERWDIKLDVLETDKESLLLSLRDRGGNQIRRTPEVICHILEHFSNVEMGFPKESWGWVLATLLAKEDELKLAQSKIGQLVTAAVADTELLFEAVMQLDDSKRFMRSDEAKKIRNWLAGELLKRLPPDDPRHKLYATSAPEAQAAAA